MAALWIPGMCHAWQRCGFPARVTHGSVVDSRHAFGLVTLAVTLGSAFSLLFFACLTLKFTKLLVEVEKSLLGLLISQEKLGLEFKILLMLIYIQIMERSVTRLYFRHCGSGSSCYSVSLEGSFLFLKNTSRFRTSLRTFVQFILFLSEK